ncbi:hypothetical protein EJ110_NYTH12896 [Nymphaea thermarum]|nr:hypothetical protein EJ110_NYTH12896 [Nymphaea thermarum]
MTNIERRSMQSMTLGDFEEELDREIEMMQGQGRGQHHAGFYQGRRGRNNEEPRLPMPRMDFPKFNGNRPKEWIYKAEQYFICQNIIEVHKVQLAKMYLEEEAIQWYCWWEEDNENPTWDLFKEEILLRFGETTYVNYVIELQKLKQTSSVQDYQGKFEKLSSMVKNSPEESKIAHFIEKWHAGHKCKHFHLYEVIESDEEEEEEVDTEGTEVAKVEEETEEKEEGLCHALTNNGPNAMKVVGKSNNQKVIVLLDTGATHNFLNSRLAHLVERMSKCGQGWLMPTTPQASFNVMVGNGAKLSCNDICKNVNLEMHKVPFKVVLYLLPIGGVDVVLGIQWMKTLRRI